MSEFDERRAPAPLLKYSLSSSIVSSNSEPLSSACLKAFRLRPVSAVWAPELLSEASRAIGAEWSAVSWHGAVCTCEADGGGASDRSRPSMMRMIDAVAFRSVAQR